MEEKIMNAEEQRIEIAEDDGVLETLCEDRGSERNRDDRDDHDGTTTATIIAGDGLDGSEPVAAALNNNHVRAATPYQIFRNSTDIEDGGAALSGIVGDDDNYDDHFDLSDTEYDPIDNNEEEEEELNDNDNDSDKENEAPTISKRSNRNNNSPSVKKLTATTPKKSSDATATDATTTTTRSGSGVLSPNSVEIRQNARKLLLRHRPRNKNAGRNNNNISNNRYRSAINDRNKKKKKRYSLPAFPVVGQPLLPLLSKDSSHNDNNNNSSININPCIVNGNNSNNPIMSKEFHELTLLKKEQIESDLADMKNAASEAFESFSDAVSLGARSVWGQAIMGFNTNNGGGGSGGSGGSGRGKKEQQQKENGNGNGNGGRESSEGGGGVRVAEKNLVKAFGQGFVWD